MSARPSPRERLNWTGIRSYVQIVSAHARKYWVHYAAPVLFVVVFNHYAMVGINVTESLPYRAFLTVKAPHVPKRGEMISFRWQGGGPYPNGVIFTKIVVGVPGDTVTREGRTFFVNGVAMGAAKEFSKTGTPLAPGPEGTIPEGQYYVMTPHIDSLDSRYALTGWVLAESIVGRAYGLF